MRLPRHQLRLGPYGGDMNQHCQKRSPCRVTAPTLLLLRSHHGRKSFILLGSAVVPSAFLGQMGAIAVLKIRLTRLA